jgi:hypothetical protein
VDPAINPTLIMWENLGYSMKERALRTLLTTLVVLVLIVATMFVVLYQSYINEKINDISP